MLENQIVVKHPGLMLKEYFLDEMKITPYQIAKDTGIQQVTMNSICHGKTSISPKNALLISKYFGMSKEYWASMQTLYDLSKAEVEIKDRLDAIQPCEQAA